MKIRQGFVSNSSSSSFVAHADIKYVAESMFETIAQHRIEWGFDKKEKTDIKKAVREMRSELEKALKRDDVISGGIGIVMPSCNYDTYIVQKGDRCYVDTCRNNIWELDCMTSDHGGDDYNEVVANVVESKSFLSIANKGKVCEYDELER